MKAPRLNRQLVLEAPMSQPDGAGGFSRDWVALGTLWAELTARTGRERSAGGGTVSEVGYRITVRAAPVGSLARPLPDQRFRLGARLFTIRAVADAGAAGRYLTCFADEEVAA
ncbi:phage head closure protein [Pukyongiella litopenaei]|uniref:Phage head closure protein n=1 Tax=Pukyongiella litopenaei TaxID=2605946 RepID=A0A2S0MRJ6_9RHOB|nr:phage head closure protein [Pukyongiella litopenaei]AVO38508.1 phage head closure protein [Pukyongiella litopenaei]